MKLAPTTHRHRRGRCTSPRTLPAIVAAWLGSKLGWRTDLGPSNLFEFVGSFLKAIS